MSSKRIKAYAFDWDDNILHMPTKMKVYRNREHCNKLRALPIEELQSYLDPEDLKFLIEPDHDDKVFADGKEWEEFLNSTASFARLRLRPDLHEVRVPDSYSHFADNQQFMIDLQEAIISQSFGPSYTKLKQAVLDARPISIITARGQSPDLFKIGLLKLIEETFSLSEKESLVEQLRKQNIDGIPEYVAKQNYYPVSSLQFKEEFNLTTPESKVSTTDAKAIALRQSVSLTIHQHYLASAEDDEFLISFGFSDDDSQHVNTAKKLFEEISLDFPRVRFVLYDTSNPEVTQKTTILSP